MASLKIRYQNQKCRIMCTDAHFPAFLLELEDKLKNQFFHSKGTIELYFSFPFHLGKEECLKLFSLCDQYDAYVMEIEAKKEAIKYEYKRNTFHNGETYRIDQECIYLGNIEKDVHIISNSNVYVMGCIKGVVDLLHKENFVCAASIEGARIRIFDSKFQIMTNCAPCKVYYENDKVKII